MSQQHDHSPALSLEDQAMHCFSVVGRHEILRERPRREAKLVRLT
jgi:hypothetical protein